MMQRLAFAIALCSTTVWAQPPHESLGGIVPFDAPSIDLEGPSHVNVVERGNKPSVEGATNVVEASIALGAWHYQRGNLVKAKKVIDAGLDRNSKDARLLAAAATVQLALDEPAHALELVELALRRDEESGPLHYLRARALHALSRLDEALVAYQSASRLESGNPRYHESLGALYYERGELEQAIESFETAGTTSRGAAYRLGLALLAANRIEEAKTVYLNALRDVDFAPGGDSGAAATGAKTYANLGAIYLRTEAWEEASDAYDKALELDPDVPGGQYNRAYLRYRRGELEGAYTGYQRALELEPSSPLAYLHLGEIDYGRGEMSSVVEWLERGTEFFDDAMRSRALLLLGSSYRKLGDVDASVRAYRAALEQSPAERTALVALGTLLREQGELAEARSLLERARAQTPEDTSLSLELAALARAEGNLAEEKALYREVLSRDGEGEGTFVVQLRLALLLLEQGETKEARERLESLLRRFPADAAASALSDDGARVLATTYGMLVAKEGALDEAAGQFEEVLNEADFVPALEAMAVLAALGGRLDDASARLTSLLPQVEGKASEALVHGNLGLVLWLDGRPGDSREYLTAAVRQLPDWLSVRAALAEVELSGRRYARAMDHASEAVALCRADVAESSALGVPQSGSLQVTLGGGPRPMCERASRSLGAALVGAAVSRLERAGVDANARAEIRNLLDRAQALPLWPLDASRALFVRGTLSLIDRRYESARGELRRALEGSLEAPLRSLAENNLGVALYNLGEMSQAEERFELARRNADAFAAATLNLGIALDERNANEEALAFYEAYVSSEGTASRRRDVRSWIENLRSVLR